ncbi:AI-2E family transporter [Alkalithermobacter paradoxus]|uniref:AI-2 transport protein TqsA n=1 Tax=Alkalithermobacter paradoxus TaxID=29349 RepID=A0A1V4I531_9FIRM|nr:AI-2 transport protein TqsA [[Clostridium] thermoalcaliphilum]
MLQIKNSLHLIIILFVSFVLFRMVNSLDVIADALRFFISIMSPFLWAFSIAYLLNPMMSYIERRFKLKRGISILVVYLLVIGIIVLIVTIVSPRIIKSIVQILNDMPRYIVITQEWVNSNIIQSKILERYGITSYVEQNINSIILKTTTFLDRTLNTVVLSIITFTSTFFRLLLGLIISIYLLKDKEVFIANTKKLMYAFLSKNVASSLILFGKEVDNIFSQFIIGKFIDSLIIGILCFLGLLVLNVDYNILISIIIGITNMIPYFGPIIGMVPAVIITVFYSPIKALWVFIFILILQQFDGLVLGPKILGDKVGVSPFWIILAIVIGGGLFGITGMFLGVPIIAVIKLLVERNVSKRLSHKKIDI